MSNRKYRKAPQGFRICHRCDRELQATADNFLRDAKRALGLAYECRACHSARKKGRDRRPERWSLMTPEQRARRMIVTSRYAKTPRGRACFLRQAYKRIDACDLSVSEVMAIVAEPCTYCGTTDEPRGLDRIDNAMPHVKGNVLPACVMCNFARGNRLSVQEMKQVGALIASLMRDRPSGPTQNEDRRENLPNPLPK